MLSLGSVKSELHSQLIYQDAARKGCFQQSRDFGHRSGCALRVVIKLKKPVRLRQVLLIKAI